MGKKDEEIARLQGVVAEKDAEIAKMNETFNERFRQNAENYDKRLDLQIEKHTAQLEELRKEFEHLDNIKTPVDLSVDITGINGMDAINQACDNAVKLMEDRFEAVGLGGKFHIIAHPHTMSLKVL